MLNTDPRNDPSYSRPARNSKFLIALIIAAAFIIASQYTSYALFSSEQTSLLWGILTGLVIGGWIFGWLKRPWE
jgi:hypothetical protein